MPFRPPIGVYPQITAIGFDQRSAGCLDRRALWNAEREDHSGFASGKQSLGQSGCTAHLRGCWPAEAGI